MLLSEIRTDLTIERQIITNGCLHTDFVQAIKSCINPNFLQNNYCKIIWGWIIEYYDKFQKSPGITIGEICFDKIKTISESEHKLILTLCEDILELATNDDYLSQFNLKYAVSKTKEWSEKQSMTSFANGILYALEQNAPEQALEMIGNYNNFVKVKNKYDISSKIHRYDLQDLYQQKDSKFFIKNLLPISVTLLVGEGAVGKSSVVLWMMIKTILDNEVFGHEILHNGRCVYCTAEDPAEEVLHKIYHLMNNEYFSDSDRKKVLDNLDIIDYTDDPVRLVKARGGNISATPLADSIIQHYKSNPPVFIAFDHIGKFGADQSRYNENETRVMSAGLKISKALDCCVLFVGHTSKEVGFKKSRHGRTLRGGSAGSDESRSLLTMHRWDPNTNGPDLRLPNEWHPYQRGEEYAYIHIGKLNSVKQSECPIIWLRRPHYHFEHLLKKQDYEMDEKKQDASDMEVKILEVILEGQDEGLFYTKNKLEQLLQQEGFRQKQIRQIFGHMIKQNDVKYEKVPSNLNPPDKKKYFFIDSNIYKDD